MQDVLILVSLALVSVFLFLVVSAALFGAYYVMFRTKKEYIKYGDRYVVRYRDKKTGKFL